MSSHRNVTPKPAILIDFTQSSGKIGGVSGIMAKLSKEKRINQELERLNNFFDQVDENQKAMATPLLQNASFMKVTLEDLQEIINKEGVTDEYQNGANQHGIKQSAVLQSYNALIKNYAGIMKTLSQLVPPAERKTLIQRIQERNREEETPEERQARIQRDTQNLLEKCRELHH